MLFRSAAEARLDANLEGEKLRQPFLEGVPAIVEALRSGKIECRVYSKDKFHAKAYITHARLEVVGSQALVGSSNFTAPGLSKNIELNVQIQSAREVAQLQEWFEAHWNDASEITDAVITTISRHTDPHTPFEIYAKALQEYFRGHELTATEWDETQSKMFPRIDRYQKEAYWALMKIARQMATATIQPPMIGAIAGETEKIIVTSDIIRSASAPEYRSRMIARPMTTPAPADRPCKMRHAHRYSMLCTAAQPSEAIA